MKEKSELFNPGKMEFYARIVLDEDSGGAAVEIPFSIKEKFGTKGRVPVRAWVDGVEIRAMLAPYSGVHYLGLRKELRQKLGKNNGDSVHIVFELDTEKREIAVPDDFQKLLAANPEAKENFDALAFTHRKEYVEWIESAKRDETRQKRLTEAISKLRSGKKFNEK